MFFHKTAFQCLTACWLAGMIVSLTGCSQQNLTQNGLIRDPANETQSAVATLAAATAPPSPVNVPPTPAPTPSLPPQPTLADTVDAPQACSAADMLVNVRSDITGNAMVFNISFSNAGNHSCILNQPPHSSLVTRQGEALEVEVNPGCTTCVPKAPIPENAATRTALAPVQTAEAQSTANDQIDLAPNQTARVIFRWTNWCNPFPPGGVAIRLDLAGGGLLTLPTDAQKAGTCTVPGQPSVLAVSPFFISS
jgi:hypothetical protein